MGERAKVILNEYSARDLLKRDTLDLDKFYTADLKLFVEVARKEIKNLNNIINELEKYSENMISEYNEAIEKSVDNIDRFNLLGARSSYREISNKIKELKGSDKD